MIRIGQAKDRVAGVLVIGLAGVSASATTAQRAEAPWKVGLAQVKITPEEPVRMSGYSSRNKPSEGVASDLFAKALAIEDAAGHRAVLVTSDLIGFRAALAESICGRIVERTGLKREQILLNSSHTHTGPTLSLNEDDLSFPPEQRAATVRYTRGLQDKLVAMVVRSLERLAPARVSRGVGVESFVMNRREDTDRGVILGVNPSGLADRSVPVLRIDAPDGRLRGVLFGAACHNTTLTGRNYEISGDFAGYSQALVERAHAGVQAMFVQGCAGDANPYPRGSEEISRQHGKALGTEVLRVLETELKPVRGPLRTLLAPIAIPLAPAPPREQIDAWARGGGWRGFVGKKMAGILDEGGALPTSYTAPIALWQFGEDLTLVGLPGEVVVDYVTMIQDALGPQRLWIAAYCNDVFGYLPSAKVLGGGGYECRGLYAGGIGQFSPAAQTVVVEKVRALAQEAERSSRP